MKVNLANIRFYDTLNDFLPEKQRNYSIPVKFKGRQSIKHIIESLGIPHPEVDTIRVNNQPVNLSYILKDKDHVEVYPWQDHVDLFAKYNIEPRFILDNHLGKLATYMRIMGIDTLYNNAYHDDEIVNIIKINERILLTRDRRLLMRREIRMGYCVRQDNPKDQIIEIMDKFRLKKLIVPLNRCLICNHKLEPTEKLSIIHRLEPLTKLYYEEFHRCPQCNQLYWKGSHYEHMLDLVKQVDSGESYN
jgi:uncharacterized protein with PIN domain/sulfur carrier protein ThiS